MGRKSRHPHQTFSASPLLSRSQFTYLFSCHSKHGWILERIFRASCMTLRASHPSTVRPLHEKCAIKMQLLELFSSSPLLALYWLDITRPSEGPTSNAVRLSLLVTMPHQYWPLPLSSSLFSSSAGSPSLISFLFLCVFSTLDLSSSFGCCRRSLEGYGGMMMMRKLGKQRTIRIQH